MFPRHIFNAVTTKTENHLKLSETTQNHLWPAGNHSAPSRNYLKPSETNRNYLQPTQNFFNLAVTNHHFLSFFSTVDFEHEFLVWKAKLGKDDGNLATVMNFKGNLWNNSQLWEIILKQVYNICLNKIT